MANDYMQTAFSIEIRSAEEKNFIMCMHMRSVALEEELGVEYALEHGYHHLAYSPFEACVIEDGWGWEVDVTETEAHFYSTEGSFNAEAMVLGLREFLEKFRDAQSVISFTWAYWCDKPRADSFGGGGVVFTSQHASWVNLDEEIYLLSRSLDDRV